MQQERVRVKLVDSKTTSGYSVNLPMHIMVVGKFGGTKVKTHKLDIKRFNNIFASILPSANIKTNNIEHMVKFNNINDFKPEALIQQIPHLKALSGIRNLVMCLRDRDVLDHAVAVQDKR